MQESFVLHLLHMSCVCEVSTLPAVVVEKGFHIYRVAPGKHIKNIVLAKCM
jgi:hypothetical protein